MQNKGCLSNRKHEVHGFAALLSYSGFICLKQKRNGVITVC